MASLFHWLEDKRVHYLILVGWGLLLLRRVMPEAHVDFDDAWMCLRYADHLLDGHGYRWNIGGEPSFGSTSVLYTFWLVAFKFCAGSFLSDTQLLSYSSLLFLFLGSISLMELTFRLVEHKTKASRSLVYASMAVCLGGRYWTYHGTTGMDTTLAVWCNTLFLWALVRLGENREQPWRWAVFIAAAYVSYLARMDHGFFVIMSPFLLLPWLYQWSWRQTFSLMALLSLPFWLDLWLKYAYFGDPLPLAYYVKQYGYYEGYVYYYYWNPVVAMQLWALLLLPFVWLSIWHWEPENRGHRFILIGLLIPLSLTLITLARSVQIMGGDIRYYIPFVPHVVAVMGLMVQRANPLRQRHFKSGRLLGMLLYFAFITGVMPSLGLIYEGYWFEATEELVVEKEQSPLPDAVGAVRITAAELAMKIKALPDTVLLAAGEHGRFGALLPRFDILDLTGLHDPRFKKGGASIVPILAKDRPGLIWMPHPDYVVLNRKLRQADFFREHYHYFPQAYGLGLAIRRDLIPLLRARGVFPELLEQLDQAD